MSPVALEYSTTAQTSQRRLSEACVRATKPVRPSCKRWNQWTTSPSRNCCDACRRICRRASAGSIQIRFTESWSWSRKPIGPARLVEAPARPDPLRQGLVLEPVEVAVELGVAGLRPRPCPSGQPPAPGLFQARPGPAVGSRYLRMTCLGPLPVVGLAQDHDDASTRRRAGISSVARNAAIGRSSPVAAGPARPVRPGRDGRRPSGAEEPASRRLDPVGRAREGGEGRARSGRCCAGSRRRGRPGPCRLGSPTGPTCSGWSASTIWK